MSIIKTTCYKTRDGQAFDDILAAQIHETALDLTGVCIAQGFENGGQIKLLCLSIAKNFDKYEAALTKISKAHKQMARKKAGVGKK